MTSVWIPLPEEPVCFTVTWILTHVVSLVTETHIMKSTSMFLPWISRKMRLPVKLPVKDSYW